ncbi:MAG: hypothetical protein ACK4M9_01645 [Anaerobacillus sp.]|uniref:hypothetical protein n=1 Tax=Anaerobacillus sp. TaxID=1872506 RepID=UPI003918AD39
MRKILFLDEDTRINLQKSVNKQLEIKNRLLKLLFENENHKLSSKEVNVLHNKYQEQIYILDLIQSNLQLGTNRKVIQDINRLIDIYNKSDIELVSK